MKKIACLMSVALTLFFFAGCAPKLSIRFASLPGQIPEFSSRGFENKVPSPLSPAGGFVYIQTGLAPDSAVFGPYPVAPDKPFTVKGLPAGTYERLAVFYSPVAPSGSGLPLTAGNDDDFWLKAGSPEFASAVFQDAAAVALFGGITLRAGRKTVLQATLIPLSGTVFDVATQNSPRCLDTAGTVRKQFIKLESGSSQSLYAMLSNFDGEGLVYAGTISLYGSDGTLIETKNFNKQISQDMPEAVLFPFHSRPGPFYLYVEYIGTGNRSLPLLYY